MIELLIVSVVAGAVGALLARERRPPHRGTHVIIEQMDPTFDPPSASLRPPGTPLPDFDE